MANTLIVQYLGGGLFANRPATPAIDTGAAGYYYATDTNTLYCYAGGSWNSITAPASAPTIVQSGVNAGASIQGVTLGAAPTNGNTLVAILAGGVPTPNTGWVEDTRFNAQGATETYMLYKFAGASESATQNPANANGNYAIAIFELSANATPAGPLFVSAGSVLTLNETVYGFKTAGVIIGAAISDSSTNLPSSITGATGGATSASGTRSIQAFSNTAPAKSLSSNVITANWGSSANYRLAAVFVG